NCIRLPFRWERLQTTTNSTLVAAELARMDSIVNYATGKGMYVVLDPHNYARYYPDTSSYNTIYSGNKGVIRTTGTTPITVAAFRNFWPQLSAHFMENDHVIFDLMNEPTTLTTEACRTAANAAIVAIRATGATNLILVPGNGWTSAWNWSANFYG